MCWLDESLKKPVTTKSYESYNIWNAFKYIQMNVIKFDLTENRMFFMDIQKFYLKLNIVDEKWLIKHA